MAKEGTPQRVTPLTEKVWIDTSLLFFSISGSSPQLLVEAGVGTKPIEGGNNRSLLLEGNSLQDPTLSPPSS